MKLKARLINKERPTLLIKKNSKLKLGNNYKIKFVESRRDEELISCLRRFDDKYYCFKFVHKIMGAFNLKYQKDYEIEISSFPNKFK